MIEYLVIIYKYNLINNNYSILIQDLQLKYCKPFKINILFIKRFFKKLLMIP